MNKRNHFYIKIKRSIAKNAIKHPWSFWFIIFFVPFVVSLILSFYPVPLSSYDPDTAKFLLSSLMQSQAAIIAIVITLTTIAVQVASATYSGNVTELFKEYPHTWGLLLSYVISISFDTWYLNTITGNVPINHYFLNFSIVYATLIFFPLACYIRFTMYLLKSGTLLEILSMKITRDIVDEDSLISVFSEDTLNSYFDTLYPAILKYDTSILDEGLKTIKERFNQIADTLDDSFEQDKKKFLYNKLFRKLKVCGDVACRAENEESMFIFIKYITQFCNLFLNKQNISQTDLSLFTAAWVCLREIKSISEEHKFKHAVSMADDAQSLIESNDIYKKYKNEFVQLEEIYEKYRYLDILPHPSGITQL
jgi:hypothetical protein